MEMIELTLEEKALLKYALFHLPPKLLQDAEELKSESLKEIKSIELYITSKKCIIEDIIVRRCKTLNLSLSHIVSSLLEKFSTKEIRNQRNEMNRTLIVTLSDSISDAEMTIIEEAIGLMEGVSSVIQKQEIISHY